MRLLLTWVQIHPAIREGGRVQVGAHQAVDAENFDAGRRYDPDTDLDTADLDAAMAASPPRSVADFLALVSGELSTALGLHVTPQEFRPRPEPQPEAPAEPAPAT